MTRSSGCFNPYWRQPIVLVVMTTHNDPAAPSEDALVAAAAKIAVAAWVQ